MYIMLSCITFGHRIHNDTQKSLFLLLSQKGFSMKRFPLGITHTLIFETNEHHSAHAYGNTGLFVLATAALIAFTEEVCGQWLQQYLTPEERSVGTIVSIKHRAVAPIGVPVQVSGTLIEQNENKVLFSVQVCHDDRLLLDGTHGRVVCIPHTLFSPPS